jgi:MFS transporter, DHA1 family, multidrug resistance protein
MTTPRRWSADTMAAGTESVAEAPGAPGAAGLKHPAARFLDRSTPPHIVTLVIFAGLSAMTMNIFLPSLPAMAAQFGVDYRVMQLSVALYLGVSALLQIVIGPLSDRFGRRPVVLGATLLFMAATLGCLLASSAWVFLGFRMAQAVIVTGMVLSRAIVRDMVDGPRAASMIGYVTMGMALVPMVSPAIGGALDEWFGWQASFVLLLAAGALVFALAWADQGETARRHAGGLAAQLRQMPALLRSSRFWGHALTAAFCAGAFFAYLGGGPYVGAEVYGLAPAALGLHFGAPAVGYALGNYLSGRWSVRAGIDRMVMLGALLCTGGLALSLAMTLAGTASVGSFFALMCFVGLGNGLVIPNATAGMLSVDARLAGTASGLGGAIMVGGGAALSALAGAMLGPGSGAAPLLWIMFLSALASVAMSGV